MKTTADYLDALRVRFNVPSDYGLQTATGWHRQQISRYRTKKGTFDDETAQRVAAWLEKPLEEILLDMNAQRAKSPEVKKAWMRASQAMASGAIALFLLVVFYRHGIDLEVISAGFLFLGNTHYTNPALQIALTLALAACCCAFTARTIPGRHRQRRDSLQPQ